MVVAECRGHSSHVKCVDWSTNSLYIRSNSADLDLLYWNPLTGDQITDPEVITGLHWASQNCLMTFETLGVWGDSEADRTDINSVSAGGQLLASGDDGGRVRLYTNPSIHINSGSKDLLGHSAHVTAVEFLQDDHSRLISAGGRETAVLQWKM